jgi:hypothetical protein
MSNTGAGTPTRGRRFWAFIGSKGFVGSMAACALILSLAQWLAPLRWDWFGSYKPKGVTPDLVNFFCEGSEGLDTAPGWKPHCLEGGRLTLLASPLSYINESKGDRAVWLRREFVRITYEDAGRQPTKAQTVLFWNRVKSQRDWEPPSVVQLKAGGDTTSHSTLFYPSHLRCKDGVQWEDCEKLNTYAWAAFSDDVAKDRIKYAVLEFEPEFLPKEAVAKAFACEVIFEGGHKRELDEMRAHPDGPAIISAACKPTSPED